MPIIHKHKLLNRSIPGQLIYADDDAAGLVAVAAGAGGGGGVEAAVDVTESAFVLAKSASTTSPTLVTISLPLLKLTSSRTSS